MTVRPPSVDFVSLRAPSNFTTLVVERLAVTTEVANCATSSASPAASPVSAFAHERLGGVLDQRDQALVAGHY